MLPPELINKILSYNIHPVAELLKPYSSDYLNFYERDYDNFWDFVIFELTITKEYCYDCHGIFDLMIFFSNKNFCEDCAKYIDPNDDIVTYSSFELIEFRTCLYAVLNRMNN